MRAQQLVAGVAVLVWLATGCDQESPQVAQLQPDPSEQPDEMGMPPETMDEMMSMRDLDEGPAQHLMVRPGDLEWQPGPASLEEGAQMAMLEGDFAEDGVFAARFRLPDGFVVNPHWHANVERLTVLRGTFHLGMGEELDRAAAEALTAGSYTSMPKEMVHFAIAEGETVVQLTSVGPWEIHYVNPEDDPRQREMPVSERGAR
jgi:quercetin dioxygenase-like cupin family protein